jgi:hypothetical protein
MSVFDQLFKLLKLINKFLSTLMKNTIKFSVKCEMLCRFD